MPRKTSARAATSKPSTTSFNEAAARCRGKRAPGSAAAPAAAVASMRPRPDAAENFRRGRLAGDVRPSLQ